MDAPAWSGSRRAGLTVRAYIIRSRRERVCELVGLGLVFGLVAAFTVAAVRGTGAGDPDAAACPGIGGAIFLWAIALSGLYFTLAMPFEVLLADDGTVTFRRLLGDTTASAREIRSISCMLTPGPRLRWLSRKNVHIGITLVGTRMPIRFYTDLQGLCSFIAAVCLANPMVELWFGGGSILQPVPRKVAFHELWWEAVASGIDMRPPAAASR
jgi:hypothetical protein